MPLLHYTLLTAPHCPQEEGSSSPQSGIQGPAHCSLPSTKRLFEIPFLPILHLANSYSHFKNPAQETHSFRKPSLASHSGLPLPPSFPSSSGTGLSDGGSYILPSPSPLAWKTLRTRHRVTGKIWSGSRGTRLNSPQLPSTTSSQTPPADSLPRNTRACKSNRSALTCLRPRCEGPAKECRGGRPRVCIYICTHMQIPTLSRRQTWRPVLQMLA